MHSVAMRKDGRPFTFGCSDDGALGRLLDEKQDTELQASSPGEVTGFFSADGINEDGTIIDIAAGDSFTVFLTIRGNVYMTGM